MRKPASITTQLYRLARLSNKYRHMSRGPVDYARYKLRSWAIRTFLRITGL